MPRSLDEMRDPLVSHAGHRARSLSSGSLPLSDTSETGSSSSSAGFVSYAYTPMTATEIDDALVDLAHPYTGVLHPAHGRKADGLSFQPCRAARSQDRYVVEQFAVRGDPARTWTLTGVFDGHLGEATVDHAAHHLPVIIQEFFERAAENNPASIDDPEAVSALLKRAIASFDRDIANDVLELFPGGMDALGRLTDEEIRRVINDHDNGLQNYKKVQLNMYGTTALVALVDPRQEHLWVANLGDCQAVLASRSRNGEWTGELLTTVHNGSNPSEVERVRRAHPGEPDCIKNGRVLGAIAPFRCLGDQPFKQPPAFTRRILFNLDSGGAGYTDISPWEQFLLRNLTPPYISAEAEVVHRRLAPVPSISTRNSAAPVRVPNHFLVLCTDGLQDVYDGVPAHELPNRYVDAVVCGKDDDEAASFRVEDNLALRLLKHALGGDDPNTVSQQISIESNEAWIDDVTIVVQIL